MIILGFLFLSAIAAYVTFAGAFMVLFSSAITGKTGFGEWVILAFGLALCYLAYVNCPFTLSVTP